MTTRYEGADIADVLAEVEDTLGVRMADHASVTEHMTRHPQVRLTLPVACRVARDEFGPAAQLELEVFSSHEEPHDAFLVLNVRVPEYPDDMSQRLDQARSRYEELTEGSREWVLITTDFG